MRWRTFELNMNWSVRRTQEVLEIQRQKTVIVDMMHRIVSSSHRPITSSQVFKATSIAILCLTSMNNVRIIFNFYSKNHLHKLLIFSVAGEKYEKTQRRASVCSLDSGTSLSFLSSNGTRGSDNKKNHHGSSRNNYNQSHQLPSSPLAAARSTEV